MFTLCNDQVNTGQKSSHVDWIIPKIVRAAHPMPKKSIGGFCGSRPGNDLAFTADAEAVGQAIAAKDQRMLHEAGDFGQHGGATGLCQAQWRYLPLRGETPLRR